MYTHTQDSPLWSRTPRLHLQRIPGAGFDCIDCLASPRDSTCCPPSSSPTCPSIYLKGIDTVRHCNRTLPQVSTYMHWHPWRRDRRLWGNCGYWRHPAQSTCSLFVPWCVSDSPEIYKLQNERREAIPVIIFSAYTFGRRESQSRKYNCKQILWK